MQFRELLNDHIWIIITLEKYRTVIIIVACVWLLVIIITFLCDRWPPNPSTRVCAEMAWIMIVSYAFYSHLLKFLLLHCYNSTRLLNSMHFDSFTGKGKIERNCNFHQTRNLIKKSTARRNTGKSEDSFRKPCSPTAVIMTEKHPTITIWKYIRNEYKP